MLWVLKLSAWIWCYVFARFLIWSRRLEGITWLPFPNASSWYRLTELSGKIHHKQLAFFCVASSLSSLGLLMFASHDDFLLVGLLLSHTLTTLWWPGFMELKFSWRTCFIIACVTFTISCVMVSYDIDRYGLNEGSVLFVPTYIGLQAWVLWITAYAYHVVKTPRTVLEYHRRESRTLDV